MVSPKAEVTAPRINVEHDLEKAMSTADADDTSKCKPTISAIDVHLDGQTPRTKQHPRGWREDEVEYIASLPPLAPKCTRIYLREEDCRARDVFAAQGTQKLEAAKQYLQWIQQISSPDSSLELVVRAVARALENSSVNCWRSVHKADRFDVSDLRNLFNQKDQASRCFLIQLNMEASQAPARAMLGLADFAGTTQGKLHAGQFNSATLFWEKYATIEVCRSAAEGAFEVHCWFPALSYLQLPEKPSDQYVFPLLTEFEQLLCSDDSSMPRSIEDPSMVQSYVVLDYLRCVTLSWLNFLKRVNHASSSPSPRSLSQSEHDNDSRVTAEFCNAVDDLKACISYVLDRTAALHDSALAEQLASKMMSEHSSHKDRLMVQDLKLQLEYLSRRSASLRERSQRLAEKDKAVTSNSQAQSAGRLTVVASIFLPLTLAASLLAMNVPAASLGRLWYDFAGMCICIAFIAFACYTAYSKVQNYTESDGSSTFGSFIDVAYGESNLISRTTHFLWYWGIPTVIAASFLAGMFYSFDVALDALKYGLPIIVGIRVLYWVFSFMIFTFPDIHDAVVTWRFIARTGPLAQNGEASQTGFATMPNLSKRFYHKWFREMLVSAMKALQSVKANRPADEEILMTDLVQQFFEEFVKHGN